MLEFAYTARNIAGENVEGTITAQSKRDAVRALAEQSLYPLQVEDSRPAAPTWLPKKRVSVGQITITLAQLSDLLDSGVPLLRSLDVLVEQTTNAELAQILADIRNRVADGTSLDVAMAAHSTVFSELTISMVRAGLEGAFLEDSLKRTAEFLEQQQELKARVVGAMIYPVILAVAGFTVTVVLLVFFVPKFEQLFARLEQQGGLPTATVWLLWISDVLGSPYGLVVASVIVIAGLVAWRQLHSERGRLLADTWKLRLPVAGRIFLGFALSRFCRILGTLLRNGVPLLKALDISSDSTGNKVLAKAIHASAENISSGETLARPLAQCGIIPRPIMAMISVAEESNRLEDVLINIADGIDRQLNRQLDLMVRMVEPAMLLVMASVILFVLMALLLPVFEMSATIG